MMGWWHYAVKNEDKNYSFKRTLIKSAKHHK